MGLKWNRDGLLEEFVHGNVFTSGAVMVCRNVLFFAVSILKLHPNGFGSLLFFHHSKIELFIFVIEELVDFLTLVD